MFETNVLKSMTKTIFIGSSPFAFLNINVRIVFNFQKEWCTFSIKNGYLKIKIHFQGLNALNMQKKIDLCQALSM
jgi:hypothetical protein